MRTLFHTSRISTSRCETGAVSRVDPVSKRSSSSSHSWPDLPPLLWGKRSEKVKVKVKVEDRDYTGRHVF